MQKGVILDKSLLDIVIQRLCQELIENHGDFSNTALLGLQPRGVHFAERIQKTLESTLEKKIDCGKLDITFYRDDFRRKEGTIKANATKVPFLLEEKNVILIDDVLFTGRSVRAALDAMIAFGRPKAVELLVLIDRKYTRDLPIQPDYVGKHVNSMISQKVIVDWEGVDDVKEDKVWLINDK